MEASGDSVIQHYATARRAQAKEIQVRDLQVEVSAASKAGSHKEGLSPLGLSADYVQDWNTAAAFRELFRNWKDAIIESFHIHIRDFQPHIEEDENCVTILVPTPPEGHLRNDLMGYIKYDRKSGCLSLVNACSQFESRHLHVGPASANYANEALNYRGEGLKFAAIAMSRHGYEMSVAWNGSQWTFACDDTAPSQGLCWWRLSKPRAAPADIEHTQEMDPLSLHQGKAVCVSVGPGAGPQGRAVGPEEFEQWLDTTMDIRGFSYPTDIIGTRYGDIILDPKHEGRVYVGGVHYPSVSPEQKLYTLGYNFLDGRVDRDGRRPTNSLKEARLITQIWEIAIQQDAAFALPTYVCLLRSRPHARDVELAEQFLQSSSRMLIWRFLQEESNNTGFYCCEDLDPEGTDIIRRCFKKEPLRLPLKLWTILRSHNLVRTPSEEVLNIFQTAGVYRVPETSFAKHVQRGLAACLELFAFSKRVEILFVDCENSCVDMCFDRDSWTLKVHRKWLNYEATHQGSPCRVFIPSTMALTIPAFSCDHIIEELACKAFRQIAKWDEHRLDAVVREIRDRLRMMPRDISCDQANSPGCLRVSWCDNEMDRFTSQFGSTIWYHIVLHEEKCAERSADVLHTERANLQISRAQCGCPQAFAPQSCKVVVFRNLDHSQKFYPMVALNHEKAFYGVPPPVASPLAPSLLDDSAAAQEARPVQRRKPAKSRRSCRPW